MLEKIEIVNLCVDTVTIKRQKTYTDGKVTYDVGFPICKGYSNSVDGRADLSKEVAEPYLGAIMLVWGTEPTVVPKEEQTL